MPNDKETVTVASSAPMAMQIYDIDPQADPAKPGLLNRVATAILFGNRHPEAVNGLGITRGVDGGLFRRWLDAHPHLADVLQVFSDEDLQKHADAPKQFGFEPGLEAAAQDNDNNALIAQGSTIDHPAGQVTDREMAATSDTPNDDSPRSQTTVFEGGTAPAPAAAAPETTAPAPATSKAAKSRAES